MKDMHFLISSEHKKHNLWDRHVEVCDIVGDNIVIVLKMCDFTLSSILQKPFKTQTFRVHTYIMWNLD